MNRVIIHSGKRKFLIERNQQKIIVDNKNGIFIKDEEIKTDYQEPYGYVGRAKHGSAEDYPIWKITRFEFFLNGVPTKEIKTGVKWTDRFIIFN